MYEELSVTLFVSGYLPIIETGKPALKLIMSKHLEDMMADTEVYG